MSMPSKRGVALIANDERSHRDDFERNKFEPPNPQIADCPSCKSRHLHYNFSCRGFRVVECNGCGLMMLNPQPSDDQLAEIYGADYYLGDPSDDGRQQFSRMKRATAKIYLDEIEKYRGADSGRLLEIGCGPGDFLLQARERGYDVTGIEINAQAVARARQTVPAPARVIEGTLENAGLEHERFDVCVLSDVIEHVRNPVRFLEKLRHVLAPGAALFVTTPSLKSW